jgi:transcription-repair coupling factor (superfamily II helicase)
MISQANIYEYLLSTPPKELILCRDDKEAEQIEAVVRLAGVEPIVLPDVRVSVGEDLRSYGEEVRLLLSQLSAYYNMDKESKKILIAPLRTVLLPFPKPEFFVTERIEFGDTVDLAQFKDRLYHWGYHFTDITAQQGEVSVRGDIIDLFPIDATDPYRISLFDDEIDEIHRFDPSSQKRQGDEVEGFTYTPAFLALNKDQHASLKLRCERSPHESFVKDIDALGLWHLKELGEWALDRFGAILAENMDAELGEIYDDEVSGAGVRPQMFNGFATEHLRSDPNANPSVPRKAFVLSTIPTARAWRDLEVADPVKLIEAHPDKSVTIVARNESIVRGSALALGDRTIHFIYQEGIVNLMGRDGFILSLNKPIKRKKVKKASMVLDELSVGDYVVHENHGVGIFRGIEKREVLGATSEFVVITYQGDDTLLIPVSSLETIDRYVAEGGSVPVLDRMGKASFKRLKEKVREKLFAIASQIINLSAQRHLKKGIILACNENVGRGVLSSTNTFTDPEGEPVDVLAIEAEHKRFMTTAGFEHTEDQRLAIDTMLDEMQSGRMMDRLLSADVGFGKTEVAMNGIFIAVKNGYQAMMIAPTTLLSSQHYKSLKERFYDFGISVAKLDRFTTPKEKRAVLAGLAEGRIDAVVGTHALLGAKFKHLAFVVIDEEHKFGVKQKEALKEMAIDVHVLSMSATPIPRSLNLALTELKSFSEILTPPLERVGVRTFVKSYDPKVIKEAITREIRRGGQIFYVYNSIAGIEAKRKALLEILPKLRTTVLHSKISAVQTEEEMMKFEDGEYDLLLSTSIVESGIHMPHANTMIVDGADRFGMADLHQLRGRVGRGGKEGFCYFVVSDTETLTDTAKRRLLALESHSELGSGATLAYHDLQIRGGGNIIGEAQSGHIKQIGYSLYLRMLEDAIRELSGRSKEVAHQVEMKLSVNAYLNEELIGEDRLRLELYRRLSLCETVGEVYSIEEEINDRFGTLDILTRQFIDVMAIKVLARKIGISKVSSYGSRVFIEYVDSGKERVTLEAKSKDDDDIIGVLMHFLKKYEQ